MIPKSSLALNWSYFRKVQTALDGSDASALTACLMEPSNVALDSKSTPGKYKVTEKFTLTVRVDRSSWVVNNAIKTDAQSTRLLNHERTHYLLASCVAFDLYRELKAVEEDSSKQLQVRLNELRATAAQRVQDLSDDYDRESQHGNLPDKQKAWDLRIQRWDQSQSE
jgi:predicted secreted Zn-dependent protease